MAVVLSVVEIFILKPKFFENVSISNLGSKKFTFTPTKTIKTCKAVLLRLPVMFWQLFYSDYRK